jgi:putative membrane protein
MMLTRGFGGIGMFGRMFGFAHPGALIALAVVFVAAIIVIIVLSARKKQAPAGDAVEALKLRFIKGEITEEEYLKMKSVIGK